VDVIHVHWPEFLARGPVGPVLSYRRLVASVWYLVRARHRRVPVVWTQHNTRPHEDAGWIERWYLRWFERRVDVRIYLNESGENDPRSGVVVLHHDYASWYESYLPRPAGGRRAVLACLGILRPYKGFESAITAFRELKRPEARLVIAGRAVSAEYVERLRALADGDARIEIREGYVEDPDLVALLDESAAVVLPYTRLYNSGAALLALTFDVPVLVPSGHASDSLRGEFGAEWVRVHDGPVTSSQLEDLFVHRPAHRVDRSRRDVRTGAGLHLEVYRVASEWARESRDRRLLRRRLATASLVSHSAANRDPAS
jgi:beta-1,4-mannosyltransferase